ncbi:methylated-DNA--[protein]-cysteine S-methyltransferase [Halobaculum litoreum]|uniref:Methylated-DNA--[protein]-cysteine S-methyltransferase n=1 Tax=Halobaculum litoreum TaxID=3031998 RepID=A0ABD5XT87_9EURY
MTLTVPGGELVVDAAYVDAPTDEIRRQAREYRTGSRESFDLPVRYPDGFLGRVMGAMAAIPYGETRTYGDVAADLGNAPQPVGAACGRNPVPLLVPCHRVVAADGVGGFSAAGGPALKRRLLDHERSESVQTTLADAPTRADGDDTDAGDRPDP